MAVKPSDTKKLTEKEETEVKTLEDRIDKMLMGDVRTFQIWNFSNDKVRGKIVSIYTTAGWHINYECDPRDGDYLTFSERGFYDGGCKLCGLVGKECTKPS